MRTRCPCCGVTLSLDVLVAHESARKALSVAFGLSGELGAALLKYLALFRPEKKELTMERVFRLLSEIVPDIQAQRIMRDGKVYDAPVDAWIWAIRQSTDARESGRLKTPLKGHGWLYEVISGYRPSGAMLAAPDAPGQANPRHSKTLGGIAALEGFKHGK